MIAHHSVATQSHTATRYITLRCRCAGLSFLATLGFFVFQKLQAGENVLPNHQIRVAPAKAQPQFLASFVKRPFSFETTRDQTDARVRFPARGGGFPIFLNDGEATLTLQKSLPGPLGMTGWGRFGPPALCGPFDPRAGRGPSLAGVWGLLGQPLVPGLSQMVPLPASGEVRDREAGIYVIAKCVSRTLAA